MIIILKLFLKLKDKIHINILYSVSVQQILERITF